MAAGGRAQFKWDMPSRHDVKAERKREQEALERRVFAAVDARDKRICRCCGRRSNLEGVGLLERGHRHHIVFRSAGGSDSQENLITLCGQCHADVHHKRLDIRGNADDAVSFWRRDAAGAWFLSKQEIAVGVIERD